MGIFRRLQVLAGHLKYCDMSELNARRNAVHLSLPDHVPSRSSGAMTTQLLAVAILHTPQPDTPHLHAQHCTATAFSFLGRTHSIRVAP